MIITLSQDKGVIFTYQKLEMILVGIFLALKSVFVIHQVITYF